MAALGWTLAGPVEAVSDTQNADVLREPTSKQHEALVDIMGPLLAEALVDYPELAGYFEDQIDAKVAGLDIALRSEFTTTGQTGYFTFPKNTVPSPTAVLVDGPKVDAANYAAGMNLATAATTGTVKAVGVRFGSGTGGAMTVSADTVAADRSFRATAGTLNPVVVSVDMGGPVGGSTVVMKTLNAVGATQGVGGYLGGRFDGSTIRYLQWNLSASGRSYILQKAHSDTGYSAIVRDLLVSSTVQAQPGDVVSLQLDAAGVLTLVVNGVTALTYTLSASEKTAYASSANIYAGVLSDPTVAGPTFKSWTGQSLTYPLVNRKVVTVDGADQPSSAFFATLEAYIRSRSQLAAFFDIRSYGAKCDGRELISGVMTAGSNLLTSGYAFTQEDVGKRVAVLGAKPIVPYVNGNGVMIASIVAAKDGAAILSQAAEVSVTGAKVMFGTVDDLAINAARDAAVAAGGGTVLFPANKITIVNSAHLPTANVSYMGANRWTSKVAPLKNLDESQPVGAPALGSWMFSWETSSQNPDKKDFLYNVDVHDFTIICTYWSAQTTYTAGLKPLNLFRVSGGDVYNMTIVDSPATAIPWDQSINGSIYGNIIINPGRLCPPSTSQSQFGGSGIGVGTGEAGQGSQWITRNVIIGTQTATTTGVGQNGIFVEANASITDLNDKKIEPINIIGNTIIGMPFGITEAGGVGSIIADNQIIRCGIGIALRYTNIKASAPGLDANIHDNTIRDCAGPLPLDGTGIYIRTIKGADSSDPNWRPNIKSALNTKIHDNTIFRCSGSGVYVRAGGVGIDGVQIYENTIRENGLSGIHIARGSSDPAPYRMLFVSGNFIHENGQRGVTTDRAGILVDALVQWTGGCLMGESRIYDLQTTPTQVGTIVVGAGAVLTNVQKDATPVYW